MISAILLAAGLSKRMAGENKLTKKIQGVPLIKHSVKNILAAPIDELIIKFLKLYILRLLDCSIENNQSYPYRDNL